MTRSIKDMVKDRKVTFTHYRAGNLWYITECQFRFPVPVSDTGEATFLSSDKAILFMRYIRKHLALEEKETEPVGLGLGVPQSIIDSVATGRFSGSTKNE